MERTHNAIAVMVQVEMAHVLMHILSECSDFLMELQILSLTTDGWPETNLKLFAACHSTSPL